MKRTFRKLGSLLLALCMILSLLPMTALAAQSGDGSSLNDSLLLVISSDTGMSNWVAVGSAYSITVTSIIIGDSVTAVSDSVFINCANLVNVGFQGNSPPVTGSNAFNTTNLGSAEDSLWPNL
ncbi:MAG: hypothetical protein ABFD25_00680 [Clostridiaceae bacterium]